MKIKYFLKLITLPFLCAAISIGLSLALSMSPNIGVSHAKQQQSILLHDKGLGTYYVDVNLADTSVSKFMLDTGSGYVAINEQSLVQLKQSNKAQYVKDIKGVMANGKNFVVPVWRISKITLDQQCVLHNIEAAVLPGKTRQILGLNALKKAGPLTLSFSPPQMTLNNCESIPLDSNLTVVD